MVGESEEEKLSLGGKCEQRPWLVLKMPVARQAKHETCVRGMAMVLYSDPVLVLASNSVLADGTSTAVAAFSGSQARRAAIDGVRSFGSFGRLVSIFHEAPRTENKNRISHENESDLPLAYHVVVLYLSLY
jgi:hypothetical protein